jgi:hypothetical protein
MGQGTSAAAGFYPVPGHNKHGTVERDWDGDVWLDVIRPAPEGVALAKYKRHLWRFLRAPNWMLLLVLLVCTGLGSLVWSHDRDADTVSGIQLTLPVLSLVGAVAMMSIVVVYAGRRVRFDQLAEQREIVRWGVISGVVAIPIAVFFELWLPELLDSDPKDWTAIAGPAEESAKLLIPVLLWFKGRFRLPRAGFMLVIVSAATFGALEATRYGFQPDIWEPNRPFGELLHPLFTGFVAAIAWRAAYKRDSWFSYAAVGAALGAMFLHSLNDVIALDDAETMKALGAISLVVGLIGYFLLKHTARQLVPPDNVESVSPRWRPVPPRKSERAEPGASYP